jgi:hypothetical protein
VENSKSWSGGATYARVALALSAILAASLAMGCESSSIPGPPRSAIRLVHVSPSADPASLFVADSTRPFIDNIGFLQMSVYAELRPGTYPLAVLPTAFGRTVAPEAMVDAVLEEHVAYTAIFAGDADAVASDPALCLMVLDEAFDTPAAAQAAVRFVNAIAGSPPLSFDVGADGRVEVAAVAPFADAGAAGIAVAAGSDLTVDVGDASSGTFVRLSTFTVPALDAGSVYFAIMEGSLQRPVADAAGIRLMIVGVDSYAVLAPVSAP